MYKVTFDAGNYYIEEEYESEEDIDILSEVGYAFSDEIEEVAGSLYPDDTSAYEPLGDFSDWMGLACDAYDCAVNKIIDELDTTTIKIEEIDDVTGEVIGTNEEDICDYLYQIRDDKNCDNGSMDYFISNCIAGSYTAFCEQGEWFFGLKSKSGEVIKNPLDWPKPIFINSTMVWRDGEDIYDPIIWFGIRGEEPIEHWIISREDAREDECWKAFWFPYGRSEWDILMNNTGDYILTWMFAEFGKVVPDNTDLLEKCPIKLKESDAPEDVVKNIDAFFLREYEQTL